MKTQRELWERQGGPPVQQAGGVSGTCTCENQVRIWCWSLASCAPRGAEPHQKDPNSSEPPKLRKMAAGRRAPGTTVGSGAAAAGARLWESRELQHQAERG